jgi:hypothetical protein
VTLSTAKIDFIDDFINLGGLEGLKVVLVRLNEKVVEAGSVDEQNIGEAVKCLRVLMNTDVSLTFATLSADPVLRRDSLEFLIDLYWWLRLS